MYRIRLTRSNYISKVVDTPAGRICSRQLVCNGKPQPLENFPKNSRGDKSCTCTKCTREAARISLAKRKAGTIKF